jgi:hypothetical protein
MAAVVDQGCLLYTWERITELLRGSRAQLLPQNIAGIYVFVQK